MFQHGTHIEDSFRSVCVHSKGNSDTKTTRSWLISCWLRDSSQLFCACFMIFHCLPSLWDLMKWDWNHTTAWQCVRCVDDHQVQHWRNVLHREASLHLFGWATLKNRSERRWPFFKIKTKKKNKEKKKRLKQARSCQLLSRCGEQSYQGSILTSSANSGIFHSLMTARSRPERWNILARRFAILAILLSATAKSDCRLRTASRSSVGASDRFRFHPNLRQSLSKCLKKILEPHTVSWDNWWTATLIL